MGPVNVKCLILSNMKESQSLQGWPQCEVKISAKFLTEFHFPKITQVVFSYSLLILMSDMTFFFVYNAPFCRMPSFLSVGLVVLVIAIPR